MEALVLFLWLGALCVVGWLVNFKFKDSIGRGFRMLFNVVLWILALAWILMALGLWDNVRDLKVPQF